MRIAAIIGATGATGSALSQILAESDTYSRVQLFSRSLPGISHPKVEAHVVDFKSIDQWASEIEATDIFLCMGTTLKKAGSKHAQFEVDYTYQANFARAARERGAKRCFVVSSPGANAQSANFYLRIKGQLDDYVKSLGFETILIKPSLIAASRPEVRLGEKLGGFIMAPMRFMPGLRYYRPIEASELARAISVIAASEYPLQEEYALGDIQAQLALSSRG
jgi:uncharacterized protein YbjT (DUF2867 family)